MKKLFIYVSIFMILCMSSEYSFAQKILIRNIDVGYRMGFYTYVFRVSSGIHIKNLVIEVLANQNGKDVKQSIEIPLIGDSRANSTVDAYLDTKTEINEIKIVAVNGNIDGITRKDLTSYIEADKFQPIKIIVNKTVRQ